MTPEETATVRQGHPLPVNKDHMGRSGKAVKRIIDIVVSLFGLAVLLPIMLVVTIAIALDGGAPIYSQERIGYKGRPFMIHKFRTMRRDCEQNFIPRTEEERMAAVTRLGRFLRDHHLDEFPQLWDVLVGHMSLVGYRPERQVFIDKIMAVRPDYADLYQMVPGLTSPATLYNGYTDTFEKMITRLDMDLEYMRTRTLWGDFKFVWNTVMSILTGKKF